MDNVQCTQFTMMYHVYEGLLIYMTDVNTNTFDDEETVEKTMIQGGQKIPKRLPLHLLDDLRTRARHALRETVDLDKSSATSSPYGRICELLH